MNEWVWTIPLVFWLVMLLLPWQPWRNRETLTVANPATHADLSDISVIIPARNEAGQICRTLQALAEQGENLHVIVVADQSQDDTANQARSFQHLELSVIDGLPLPKGWTGKLWALQQGVATIQRPITVPIWEMVSRTAFHQLKYSLSLLLIVTVIFLTIYALPWPGLFSDSTLGQTSAALSLVIMMVMYFPILRYYRLSPLWCLAVPLIALLYLAMTWSSAIAHWTGSGKGWRGRRYNNSADAEVQTLTG